MKASLVVLVLTGFIFSVTASAVVAGERVYKQVGEDGVVEFTDVPAENAEEVEISEPQTYTPKTLPRVEPPPPAPEPFRYRSLAIVTPTNEQAFPPGPGDVEVTVRVDPPVETRLRHRLELVLDGKPRPLAGQSIKLTNLDRGAHTVSVRVVDGSGKTVGESPVVTFYVQRPSLLAPGRAPAPTTPPPTGNP